MSSNDVAHKVFVTIMAAGGFLALEHILPLRLTCRALYRSWPKHYCVQSAINEPLMAFLDLLRFDCMPRRTAPFSNIFLCAAGVHYPSGCLIVDSAIGVPSGWKGVIEHVVPYFQHHMTAKCSVHISASFRIVEMVARDNENRTRQRVVNYKDCSVHFRFASVADEDNNNGYLNRRQLFYIKFHNLPPCQQCISEFLNSDAVRDYLAYFIFSFYSQLDRKEIGVDQEEKAVSRFARAVRPDQEVGDCQGLLITTSVTCLTPIMHRMFNVFFPTLPILCPHPVQFPEGSEPLLNAFEI